jgi:hypothetical protein
MAAAATLARKPKEEANRSPSPRPVSGTASSSARTSDPARSSLLPAGGKSSAVVDIAATTFAPSQTVADEIEASGSKGLDVRVIAKGLTQEGTIKVKLDKRKKYGSINRGSMLLLNPWTQKLGGMYLNFGIADSAIDDGYAGLKEKGGGKNDWLGVLRKNPAFLGGLGLKIESLPKPINSFEGGKLNLGITAARVLVGGYVDAKFDLLLENMAKPKIAGSATIDIRGAVKNDLKFESDGDTLTGSVSLAVNFKSFSGSAMVAYKADGTVDVQGKASYSADKLSGEIAFVATDEATANKFAQDAIAAAGGINNVQNASAPAPVPVAKPGNKKRSLAATGMLNFNLTTWFAGTVNVVVDGKGLITVIGKIAPPGEIILFKQRDWNKELIKFEAKAYYGIPVVGNLNLFANISLNALAKLGPAKLYNIEILGTYSTDPEVQKNIQISGSLNISAYAGLRLRAEGGAGIEILDHDLKFGVGIQADVGVKAYADARPTIGYRDPGVFYISGTLDMVAQPMLGLGGDFFIAVVTPWWSPLSDKRWTWPLFSKEWPLSDPIGISATLKDYVLGSGTVPEIEFKKPEFDASKFMTNMVDDNLPNKSGKGGDGKGAFKEDGSVKKPAIDPTKNKAKAQPGTAGNKKGAGTKTGQSGKPDADAAKGAASSKQLQSAAKKLNELKGKGPLARGALDKELAKIKGQVSGISLAVAEKGSKWLVAPKAGGKIKNGKEKTTAVEIGRKDKAEDARTQDQKRADLHRAILDAVEQTKRPRATRKSVARNLEKIRKQYGLKRLETEDAGPKKWDIIGEINPIEKSPPIPDASADTQSNDPAAKAIVALLGTKIVTVVPKAAGKLAYTKPIEGYIVDVGSSTESPSIRRANRRKGMEQLPAVYLDDSGVLNKGSKAHQKRSSESEKLTMYRQLEIDLALKIHYPEVTEANVTSATASKVRGAIRKSILDHPKYQELPDFNALISSRKLTGPGMQGELFEAWVVKKFGSAEAINDKKVHYVVDGKKGFMDRTSGNGSNAKIVEIKSRVRPNDTAIANMKDDEIPSSRFVVTSHDREQFEKYSRLISIKPDNIGKVSGNNIVPMKFTGAKYIFNMLGVAKLFEKEMPDELKKVTDFVVGDKKV